MYIEYWTNNERHYMKLSGTGITVTGITKNACFEFLKEKLDIFIKEFKMLKQVEIGNIQEGNSPYEKTQQIIFNDVECKKNEDFSKWISEEMEKDL